MAVCSIASYRPHYTRSVEYHKVDLPTPSGAAPLLRRCHIDTNLGAAQPHARSAQRQLAQLSCQRVVAHHIARALQRRGASGHRAGLGVACVLAQRLVVALREVCAARPLGGVGERAEREYAPVWVAGRRLPYFTRTLDTHGPLVWPGGLSPQLER